MTPELNHVFFNPWIGQKYQTGINSKKILILGESHHCSDGCMDCGTINNLQNCNSFTQDVILRYLGYKEGKQTFFRWMNTFTRFANVVKGKKLSSLEQIDFWNSIAFYNYVQKAISGPRISPTPDEFSNSIHALHIVIESLCPDLIIIWGQRLSNNLSKIIFHKNTMRNESIVYYQYNNLKIPSKTIFHPSSSKLSYNHTIEINEFINNSN